jgi:hypothetical protein
MTISAMRHIHHCNPKQQPDLILVYIGYAIIEPIQFQFERCKPLNNSGLSPELRRKCPI